MAERILITLLLLFFSFFLTWKERNCIVSLFELRLECMNWIWHWKIEEIGGILATIVWLAISFVWLFISILFNNLFVFLHTEQTMHIYIYIFIWLAFKGPTFPYYRCIIAYFFLKILHAGAIFVRLFLFILLLYYHNYYERKENFLLYLFLR